MSYYSKHLTLPLAFMVDEYYQSLSPAGKYAYAVLQELSTWKQAKEGYTPIYHRPFIIDRRKLQQILAFEDETAILTELTSYRLAHVQTKDDQRWMIQLRPIQESQPMNDFASVVSEQSDTNQSIPQQITHLEVPQHIQKVLLEHQNRIIQEELSLSEFERHYLEFQHTITVGAYANALHWVLKETHGSIRSITGVLNRAMQNKRQYHKQSSMSSSFNQDEVDLPANMTPSSSDESSTYDYKQDFERMLHQRGYRSSNNNDI